MTSWRYRGLRLFGPPKFGFRPQLARRAAQRRSFAIANSASGFCLPLERIRVEAKARDRRVRSERIEVEPCGHVPLPFGRDRQ
jgi:hypothetical protein